MKPYSRRVAILVAVAAITANALLSGCGGGGGGASASRTPTGSLASDLPVTLTPAVSAPSSSAGCTMETYSPNYAALIPLYRWSSTPLKVRFVNSGTVLSSDGTQVDLQQVALQGFNEWVTALGNAITVEVTTNTADANVTVHFGALPAAPTANDTLGIEQSTLYSDRTIKTADIMINTWPSMSAANISSFRETAAHEFGHALGLNGHSDMPADVMYAAHSIEVEKVLSARDVNTLKTAYCGQLGRQARQELGTATTVITND